MAEKCETCTEKCPMAEMAHNAALGRMYATNEFVSLLKKVENGELVEVVRCGTPCRWLYDEPDDYCCMNHKGLAQITPDSFCSYGRRVEENAAD